MVTVIRQAAELRFSFLGDGSQARQSASRHIPAVLGKPCLMKVTPETYALIQRVSSRADGRGWRGSAPVSTDPNSRTPSPRHPGHASRWRQDPRRGDPTPTPGMPNPFSPAPDISGSGPSRFLHDNLYTGRRGHADADRGRFRTPSWPNPMVPSRVGHRRRQQ